MDTAPQPPPEPELPDLVLDDIEARILGCLIEKALTTPDHYPLTLNALKAACNQKSNRDPMVAYDEDTVEHGLDGLRDKHLAALVHTAGGRVLKYKHTLSSRISLAESDVAALCVLLLRGPQTPGEIRGRTGRMHEFAGLDEVQETINAMMTETVPRLACKLPRQAGRKEARYAHLLCGEPDLSEEPAAPEPATSRGPGLADRVATMEEQLAALRSEFDELKRALGVDA